MLQENYLLRNPIIGFKIKYANPTRKTSIYTAVLCLSVLIFFILIQIFVKRNSFRTMTADELKYDICKLTATAHMIHANNNFKIKKGSAAYGSAGHILTKSELNPDLLSAMIRLADADRDGTISGDEIVEMKLKTLDVDLFIKELKAYQFMPINTDNNLKNYIVITGGKNAGTVLYNGKKKFIENDGRRCFGIDLYK